MIKESFPFENINIGLALSGGGVRALAYHAGVFKWMSERNCIERVFHISSVSGGSLFVGLVFRLSGYRWPCSNQYVNEILPKIKELITSKSLQTRSLCKLIFNPFNWKYVLHRAQIISKCIETTWGIKASLDQLPEQPVWSINGTAAENGCRFRFKGSIIGDYKFGYAEARNFKLATAMAVSAAFPGGIGPIVLDTKLYKWNKKKYWGSKRADLKLPEVTKIHLYDGGVYDNLGIEPIFDIGEQKIKGDNDIPNFLIVSDAGAPNLPKSIPGPLNPGRLKRVADIAFDQCRALRVRSYVNFLKDNPDKGMYFQIGFKPFDHINQIEGVFNYDDWLNLNKISEASQYPTTLHRMSKKDFDTIAKHGYETALANEIVYLKNPL